MSIVHATVTALALSPGPANGDRRVFWSFCPKSCHGTGLDGDGDAVGTAVVDDDADCDGSGDDDADDDTVSDCDAELDSDVDVVGNRDGLRCGVAVREVLGRGPLHRP